MRTIERKSLLYKSDVEYADFCLNHVEGCSHGCNFPCYAFMLAKRFGKIRKYEDWIKPKIVNNTFELLDKEISKYKDKINFVHLCFMTDPFMYGYKEIEELTLKIIVKLNKNRIKCTVLTKGIYPKALTNSKFDRLNEYGITLVSLNNKFKKKYEPFSAPYNRRINSLKNLHNEGLKTWVSIEPYPTPNLDDAQEIDNLLNKIKFVDRIIFGKMNYNAASSRFKGNKFFYEECSRKVIEFCKKNNTKYHIKCGTKKIYNKKTERIFKQADRCLLI